MSIIKYPPNTVWLAGAADQIGDIPAGVVIVPGMLVERYNNGGSANFRPCTITTALGISPAFALNQSMLNKGVGLPSGAATDNYAVADLVEVAIGKSGTTFWALVATAAPAIAIGDKLESAGDGTLRKFTTGTPIALALEALTNVSGANARLRVEVI